MALALAAYVERLTGTRPEVRPGDRERIAQLIATHGEEEFQARVTYALNHWREVLTHRLGRFIGAFDELGSQMRAFVEQLSEDEPDDCPRCNPDAEGPLCDDCEREIASYRQAYAQEMAA